MKISAIAVALGASLLLGRASAGSVGFQQVAVPDPQGKALTVAIWYPADAPASSQPIGMFTQQVAPDGAISGSNLPLILFSHGTSGSFASNYDTALALAQAGFVVAAPTHAGDNYADQSYTGNNKNLIDRPRQIKVVTDYMLSAWPNHARLDPQRIGIFGFSLGGFTALVEIGGVPDLTRTAKLCATRPNAPECDFVRQRGGDPLAPDTSHPDWVHDPRVKAAVVAAPAVSYMFEDGGLRNVRVPIELWRAENDHQAPHAWNSAIVLKELPQHPEEHVVPGQDHFVFAAPCSEAFAKAVPQLCSDTPEFDRTAFHATFNAAVVAFFRAQLK